VHEQGVVAAGRDLLVEQEHDDTAEVLAGPWPLLPGLLHRHR
jgi:hypothetical protein